jgi:hypothetical protein
MNGLATAYASAKRFDDVRHLYDSAVVAAPDSLQLLNCVAWVLASTNATALRDGKRAIALATKACELTKFRDSTVIDTLAAAYAEAGDRTDQ